MEVAGLAIGIAGLAGLFNTCVDVIARIDAYKDFGPESRSLIAQFEADRALFQKWGSAVGIESFRPGEDHHEGLDDPVLRPAIEHILRSIEERFGGDGLSRNLLKLSLLTSPASDSDLHRNIKASRGREQYEGAHRQSFRRKKIEWALGGKATFFALVQSFGTLVQKLYVLIPLDVEKEKGAASRASKNGNSMSHDDIHNDKKLRTAEEQDLWIEMKKQFETMLRKELNKWLDATRTDDMYDTFVQRRLDGTCAWILHQQEFLEWQSFHFPSETAKILWLNGNAGYGKTILCARIIQHIAETFDNPLAYFFFSSELESRTDLSRVLRSWTSQIISQSRAAFEVASEIWEKQDGVSASRNDVFDLFKAVIRVVPTCTFIVDGLDECTWVGQSWKVNESDSLQRFLSDLKYAVAGTHTRILVVSRDVREIRDGLYRSSGSLEGPTLIEYRVRPSDVKPDALQFSQSIVDHRLARKSQTQKDELTLRMTERCDSMFLWLKMLEEQLGGWKSAKELQRIIDQTPTALEDLYERNWSQVMNLPDIDRNRALSILRWATLALRPISVAEISGALCFVNDADDFSLDEELPETIDEDYIEYGILGLCGSLIETRKTTESHNLGDLTLQLVHFSVRQFILSHMPTPAGQLILNERLRSSNEALQHNVLAITCLRYLCLDNAWDKLGGNTGRNYNGRAFFVVAASDWHRHFKPGVENSSDVMEHAKIFFSPENSSWQIWTKDFEASYPLYMTRGRSEIPSANPLFYASSLCLLGLLSHLVEEAELSVDFVDESRRTALLAACFKGWTVGVAYLLQKGANVEMATLQFVTPLMVASACGHTDIVQLLLGKGAGQSVPNNKLWTPLSWASYGGHVEVAKLLIKYGAVVEDLDYVGETALHIASSYGCLEVARLLLEKGAGPSIRDNDGRTAVFGACLSGNIELVRLLLQKGADAKASNNEGWSPLHLASECGNAEIVQLLIEKECDVMAANIKGFTPLHLATKTGSVKTMQLLLDKGAKIVPANKGWTPVDVACAGGHVGAMHLLLEKGAGLRSDNRGWTPLHRASMEGHVDIVQLLLENGAQNSSSSFGWTSLHAASDEGHTNIVRLLLEKLDPVQSVDLKGRSPTFYAAKKGSEEIVDLLVQQDRGQIHQTDFFGNSPLSVAVRFNHGKVVEYLLDTPEVELDSKDNFGRTPLWWARRQQYESIVPALQEAAKKRGIKLEDVEDLSERGDVRILREGPFCDVCMLHLPPDSPHMHCDICVNANFDVCIECFDRGARCLEESHTLERRVGWPD